MNANHLPTGGEATLLSPPAKALDMPDQLVATVRKAIAALLMAKEVGGPQVSEPFREHARRQAVDPSGDVSIGQRTGAQLPEHPQSPALSEHIEQLQQRTVVGGRRHSDPLDSRTGSNAD